MAFPPAPKPFKDLPPAWADWFRQLRQQVLTPGGTVSFNSLDFTSSDISSILTRNHNSLQNIQGGAAADYQHLTTSQLGTVSSLNGLGANGFVKKSAGSWVLDTNTYLTGNQTVTLSGVISGSGTTAITTTVADEIDCIAGTTTKVPLKVQSGTNLTTATAGCFEYAGGPLLFTPKSLERGYIPAAQLSIITSDVTLNNNTSAQSPFASGQDEVSLTASTTYLFEGQIFLTTGTTSHTISFGFGGTATITSITYYVLGHAATSNGQVSAQNSSWGSSASAFTVIAATTNAGAALLIKGSIRVNAAGTLIPQITFGSAPGGTNLAKVGTYFHFWPVGTSSVQTIGTWA